MASVTVIVKHQGKKYEVEVDPSSTGEEFKFQLYSLTSVEPNRQKILIKGGQLKDDAEMGKLGLRPNQQIMMMGSPSDSGNDLVRPKEPVKFVEDMTEAEAAQQVGAIPAGLENLGNTCYLNASLQALRSIPELQTALAQAEPAVPGRMAIDMGNVDLAAQLAQLYKSMSNTQDAVTPTRFLSALRLVFPQFAEKAKNHNGYAQQDAEEAFSQIVQQLKQRVTVRDGAAGSAPVSFVDKYMGGEFASVMECDEQEARDGGEKPVASADGFLKLNCHIDGQTNHLRDGILAALSEKMEKRSDVLGRDAVYTKKSKITRAPKYLTVHFVRFFWKKETKKKAKIMRKVTFPQELDIIEFCSDELQKALIPVRDKVREIRKDEEDMERARKRRKKSHNPDDIPGGSAIKVEKESKQHQEEEEKKKKHKKEEEDKKKEEEQEKQQQQQAPADGDTVMGETFKTDAQIDAESEAAIMTAKKELNALISSELRDDAGANQSGLYELRGVVTHQGASADSGHYTAYIKKTGSVDPKTGRREAEDGNWWWFNDDKVTEVTVDKVEALAGGGESHSALILLYRAIPLPGSDGTVE